MKAKIIQVDDFIPSKGPEKPAIFIANAKLINNDENIEINLLSIRKMLGVKRLSLEYIDIIKSNNFSGYVSIKLDKKNNVYILNKNNVNYIYYLKEQRNIIYQKEKS